MNIKNVNIPETIPVPTDGALFVGGGATVGAGVHATIGGAGIAAMGTAVAIPMALVGAGAGLLLYGAYRFGKRAPKTPDNMEE